MTRRAVALLVILLVVGSSGPQAQAAPKLVSLFPLGGQRGTAVEVEIQGAGLEGTYAVWLGTGSRLKAHVQAVPDGSRAKVRLALPPDARVGFHNLSLVSPAGLSGAIPFWVGPE